MLQADIWIDKHLAIKAYKRALQSREIWGLALGHGVVNIATLLGAVATVIGLDTDYSLDHQVLLIRLSIFFTILWMFEVAGGFFYWQRTLRRTTQGWGFHATLDDEGVTTQAGETKRVWGDYSAYVEYEDYLQLTGPGGEISFLPKRPELTEIIAFTKEKILENSLKSRAPRAAHP